MTSSRRSGVRSGPLRRPAADAARPRRREPGGAPLVRGRSSRREVNKLINLPVLKDHQSAGVTLALKNLSHGLVNNVNPAATGPDN